MIIKKFISKSEEESLEAAKKELGEGIVIMNVRNVKRKGLFSLFGSKQVEVTVALEEGGSQAAKGLEQRTVSAEQKPRTIDSAAKLKPIPDAGTEGIERRLDSLQRLLESQLQKSEQQSAAVNERVTEADTKELEERAESVTENRLTAENPEQDKFIRLLYNTMLDNEVDEKYANQILEDIEKCKKPNTPIDFILANTYQKMILKFGRSEGILPAENGSRVVFFIGPTGVGKTTTIAKIASSFSIEEKRSVALLTTDTYRIAAAEQMRTYANILEVPFRVIYTDEEFKQAVQEFSGCDYIFVDTTGHSHQNEEQLKSVRGLVETLKGTVETQTFLVLSATTKYRDLLRITEKYQGIEGYQLIFTKLDETNSIGNLLNIKMYTDTPIAYVTCGQNVPDDIEVFDPQKTVKQLLGGKN